jgi:hypothetical protein
VICENAHFRLIIDGAAVAVVPRTTTSEFRRYKPTPPTSAQPRLTPGRTVILMPEVKSMPSRRR